MQKLLEIFKEEIIEQSRAEGRQYSLPVIMYLSVIAILMGAKNPIEVSIWMNENAKRKETKKLLEVEFFKAPKKSRLYDFFEIVDKEELDESFSYGFDALNTQKNVIYNPRGGATP